MLIRGHSLCERRKIRDRQRCFTRCPAIDVVEHIHHRGAQPLGRHLEHIEQLRRGTGELRGVGREQVHGRHDAVQRRTEFVRHEFLKLKQTHLPFHLRGHVLDIDHRHGVGVERVAMRRHLQPLTIGATRHIAHQKQGCVIALGRLPAVPRPRGVEGVVSS